MNKESKMISIGRDNFLPKDKILGFLYPNSHPIKNLLTEKREMNQLVDATRGKKTRTVILMDNGYVVLSSVTTNTLRSYFEEDC